MIPVAVLFALLASASALQIQAPTDTVRSSSPVTITWTAESDDPSFTIEFTNDAFNSQFAIANNVNPADGSITLTLPQVLPGDGYTFQFVNNSDVNDVYTETPTFSVAEVESSSISSSTATASTTSGTSTGTSSGTGTSTLTSSTRSSSPSSSGTGSATDSSASSSASEASEDGASTFVVSGVAGVAATFLAWLTL